MDPFWKHLLLFFSVELPLWIMGLRIVSGWFKGQLTCVEDLKLSCMCTVVAGMRLFRQCTKPAVALL